MPEAEYEALLQDFREYEKCEEAKAA